MIKYTNNVEETLNLGKKIGSLLNIGNIIFLSGDLGAGKTTFTKGIGQALNIKRTINSPTFTIVKEYNGDKTLYHMDLYRLDNIEDFELEDYFEKDGVFVIEWAKEEMYETYDHIKIEIIREDENKRKFIIEAKNKEIEKLIGEL